MFSLLRKLSVIVTIPRHHRDRGQAFSCLLNPHMTEGGGGAKRSASSASILRFEHGELPNVVQYLTMSRHTGQLYLEFPHLELQGNLFIREGQIYAAYFGPDVGIEALAAMCNCGCGRACFYAGQEVGETNVDLPTGSLLVEAVVRADERLSEGVDVPPAEGLSIFDIDPGEEDAADSSPAHSFAAGLMLMGKIGAVMGVFFAAFIANYFGYEALQDIKEQRKRVQVRWQEEEHEQRIKRMRREAVTRWYRKAEAAYQKRNYAEAANLLEITLRIDSGYLPATSLAGKLGDSRNRLMLIPVQSEAEVVLTRTADLDGGQGMADRIEALKVAMKTAEALAKAEEYERASERYRSVIQGVQQLEVAAHMRIKARAARDRVLQPRAKAEKAEASVYAAPLWEQARQLDIAALHDFNSGNFARALEQWDGAVEDYRAAAETAALQKNLETARLDLEDRMGRPENQRLLQEYASDAWSGVRSTVARARKLGEEGRYQEAREEWRSASALFNSGLEDARGKQNKADFKSFVRTGNEKLRDGKWAAASEQFEKALGIPGIEDLAEARAGRRKAEFELALAGTRSALADEDWTAAVEKAQYALKLDPENPRGVKLISDVREITIPRLTVNARVEDGAVSPARVQIESRSETYPTPVTFKLEKGRSYSLTVTALPRGYVHYKAQTFRYHATDYGPEEITVTLARFEAPEFGGEAAVPDTHIELVPILAGKFLMGYSKGRSDEKPVHEVRLTEPFWAGKYEVTNGDFRQFIAESGYDGAQDAAPGYLKHFGPAADLSSEDRLPVCYVSWKNAVAFCEWLTRRERMGGRLPAGYAYRLPTEAEWEYMCRAGGPAAFSTRAEQMAQYSGNSDGPGEVGVKVPNEWKLFDMHGNLWEMCYDTYGAYTAEAEVNPVNVVSGQFRVIRGGSWTSVLDLCRGTYRGNVAPGDLRRNLGFRVVLAPEL